MCLHGTEALYLGRGGQGPEAKAGGTPVLATRPLLTLGGRGGGKEGGRGGGREVWREEGGVEAHRGLHHPGLHGAPDMAATVHVEPVVLQRHLGEARAFACWMAGWHLGCRVAPPHLPHVPPQLLPALPHPPGTEEVREEVGSTECHLIKGSMIYIAAVGAWACPPSRGCCSLSSCCSS